MTILRERPGVLAGLIAEEINQELIFCVRARRRVLCIPEGDRLAPWM